MSGYIPVKVFQAISLDHNGLFQAAIGQQGSLHYHPGIPVHMNPNTLLKGQCLQGIYHQVIQDQVWFVIDPGSCLQCISMEEMHVLSPGHQVNILYVSVGKKND